MNLRFLTIIATGSVTIITGWQTVAAVKLEEQEAETHSDFLEVVFEKIEMEIQVLMGGELFTSLHFGDVQKPYLYPLRSADGASITRGFPMDQKPDEAADHPHHTSLWFAHGAVNGHDFWHGGRGERIVHLNSEMTKETKNASRGSTSLPGIKSIFEWQTGEGEAVCTERRIMHFGGEDAARFIDFDLTLTPALKAITFGDTKEGTFGLRLAPTLRLKGEVAQGSARNSTGITGREVWGERARWIQYSGPINEQPVTVAILDHPDNPNHPTWWHAREYGLVAANPFGKRAFEGRLAEIGDLTIQPGEAIRFRYRVIVQDGLVPSEQLDQLYNDWSTESNDAHTDGYTFEEGFDNPKVAGEFLASDATNWQVRHEGDNGMLELVKAGSYAPPQRSPHGIILLGSQQVGAFTLEADLLQTGRQYGHRDLCLFFGFQDPAHFYYAHLAAQTDDRAHNIFVVDGKPRTKISTKTTKGVDWGTNQWHHVKIVRKLNPPTIRVYLDDMTTPIMVAEDDRFEWGYVGFGSFDDSGFIDNIRLAAPQVKEIRADFFEPLAKKP